jgi:hypothetical protein
MVIVYVQSHQQFSAHAICCSKHVLKGVGENVCVRPFQALTIFRDTTSFIPLIIN